MSRTSSVIISNFKHKKKTYFIIQFRSSIRMVTWWRLDDQLLNILNSLYKYLQIILIITVKINKYFQFYVSCSFRLCSWRIIRRHLIIPIRLWIIFTTWEYLLDYVKCWGWCGYYIKGYWHYRTLFNKIHVECGSWEFPFNIRIFLFK